MFNEAKTAQMAAYLLAKSGGKMNYTKLMKLLYLTDRKSMELTGDSMTHDRFFSMKNGPVLSQTLELLQGKGRSDAWSSLVVKSFWDAKLARPVEVDDRDELSLMNMRVMDLIYDEFGHMNQWELIDWTHKNCGEWTDPGKSNNPILPGEVYVALGWKEDQAAQMERQFNERRALDRTLANFG